MAGVVRAAANRLVGVSVSRAIKPALAKISDKLKPATCTHTSKLPAYS